MNRLRSKRHTAALLAMAWALAPLGSSTTQARGIADTAFSAPDGKLFLTRELRRSILPGVDIITRRRYQIRFVRDGAGWIIEGNLAIAEVEAPAELAMLAALEKSRKDDGLFPLHLDARGMIVTQNGVHDAQAAQAARSQVSKAVGDIDMPQSDKEVAAHMVRSITAQAGSAGGNWPVDLFRPAAGPRELVRDVPLPGGKQGRITVSVNASPDAQGLLRQFERKVLTELDGTSRLSFETWHLSAQN